MLVFIDRYADAAMIGAECWTKRENGMNLTDSKRCKRYSVGMRSNCSDTAICRPKLHIAKRPSYKRNTRPGSTRSYIFVYINIIIIILWVCSIRSMWTFSTLLVVTAGTEWRRGGKLVGWNIKWQSSHWNYKFPCGFFVCCSCTPLFPSFQSQQEAIFTFIILYDYRLCHLHMSLYSFIFSLLPLFVRWIGDVKSSRARRHNRCVCECVWCVCLCLSAQSKQPTAGATVRTVACCQHNYRQWGIDTYQE